MLNLTQMIETLLLGTTASTIVLSMLEARVSRAEGKSFSGYASSLAGFCSSFISSFYLIGVLGQFNWAISFLTALNVIVFLMFLLRAWRQVTLDD